MTEFMNGPFRLSCKQTNPRGNALLQGLPADVDAERGTLANELLEDLLCVFGERALELLVYEEGAGDQANKRTDRARKKGKS